MRQSKRQRREEEENDNHQQCHSTEISGGDKSDAVSSDEQPNAADDASSTKDIQREHEKFVWWRKASDWIQSQSLVVSTSTSSSSSSLPNKQNQHGTIRTVNANTNAGKGFIHNSFQVRNDDNDIDHHFDNGDGDNSRLRYLWLKEPIKKGTVLMKIPRQAVITLKTVERCACPCIQTTSDSSSFPGDGDGDGDVDIDTNTYPSIGKMLFEVVSRVDDDKLFQSKNDALLALYLATMQVQVQVRVNQRDKASSQTADTNRESGNGTCINNTCKDECLSLKSTKFYLATLPQGKESFADLPRKWSHDKLHLLLGGTSVIPYIHKQQIGIQRDYDLYCESYLKLRRQHGSSMTSTAMDQLLSSSFFTFPPFEEFDRMLAAVNSRAFHGLGEDGVDAMIPLLDLMNHKRGSSTLMTSDVAYSVVVHEEEEKPDNNNDGDEITSHEPNNDEASKNIGKSEKADSTPLVDDDHGYICVTAKRDMSKGSIPGITYGAKGNAQLLVNYGFCLERNMEPDGKYSAIVCTIVLFISFVQAHNIITYTYSVCFLFTRCAAVWSLVFSSHHFLNTKCIVRVSYRVIQ